MNTKICLDRQPWEVTLIKTLFWKVRQSEGTNNNTTFLKVQTSEGTYSNTTVRKFQTSEGTHRNTTHAHQEHTQKKKRWSDTKSNLLIRLEAIVSDPPIPITDPPVWFKWSNVKDTINYKFMQESHFDLHKILMDHPLAPTSIGSKFRPIDQLNWILGNYPNWKRIQATICDGNNYHTIPIGKKIRITDFLYRLLKGNHKTALGERATILPTKPEKEVNKGWCIPILPNHALSHQDSINKSREIT